MIIENSPSARMQVRSRGELVAPASCCVCGNGTCDDGYLDLAVFVDFFGTLYLCMTCITQGAETVGMYTPDEVKHLSDQIENLLTDNKTLSLELKDARSYISNFNSLLQSKFATDYLSGDNASADASEITERADSGEPESAESVTLSDSSAISGTQLRDITFD